MTLKNPQLLYGVLILGALALTAYLITDYRQYEQEREEKSIQLGEQAGIRVAKALDSKLNAISERAREYAAEVANVDNETQLLQSIKDESLRFSLGREETRTHGPDPGICLHRFNKGYKSICISNDVGVHQYCKFALCPA